MWRRSEASCLLPDQHPWGPSQGVLHKGENLACNAKDEDDKWSRPERLLCRRHGSTFHWSVVWPKYGHSFKAWQVIPQRAARAESTADTHGKLATQLFW